MRENLRIHKRQRLAVPVNVQIDGWPEQRLGVLVDVSLGGARVEVPAVRMRVGVDVFMFIENHTEWLAGQVVWSSQDERTAGVRFTAGTRGSVLVRRLIAMAAGKSKGLKSA